MNEVERLAKNIQPHINNHKDKDCECWVNIDGVAYRLTGGVSTWGNLVVLFATTDGKPFFDREKLSGQKDNRGKASSPSTV